MFNQKIKVSVETELGDHHKIVRLIEAYAVRPITVVQTLNPYKIEIIAEMKKRSKQDFKEALAVLNLVGIKGLIKE